MLHIETDEDIRRAKLFSDSVNARWLAALNGRHTPALMYYKTCEPGRFTEVSIGWSRESESTERKAIAEIEKMTTEDGVRNGEGQGYGYWLGVPYSELNQYHDDQINAQNIHHKSLDEAVTILRNAIARIQSNVDPKFPPIGNLYMQLARIYFDHELYEDHDEAYEQGLGLAFEAMEKSPEYFAYDVAHKLRTLAHIYLNREQLTQALGVFARLKHARTLVSAAVREVMYEDWNLLAEFYERHGNLEEAAACYRSIGEQIDWAKGPPSDQWDQIRTAATSLIRLKKHADAEHIYEQLLDWGVSKNAIKTLTGTCFHVYPCGHWFEPYFQLLQEQNRTQHRSQVFQKLGMNEADYLPPPRESLFGYIDLEGEWKIPQRFEKAGNFEDGTAEILLTTAESEHSRSQMIDTNGDIVGPATGVWSHMDLPVPEGYRQTHRLYDGLVPVIKKKNITSPYGGGDETSDYGYADASGNIVIEARFTDALPFFNGVAVVAIGGYVGSAGGCVISLRDGKYGLIDKKGNYLIEPKFKLLRHFNANFDDGLFAYQTETEGGVITKTGEVRSVLPGCNDIFYCNDGMAAVEWGERAPSDSMFGDQKYGYLDAEGRIVIEPTFTNAHSFVGDRAAVCLNGKWGFIDRKCEMILDAKYECAENYKHGIAFVKVAGKWGCIDGNGAVVVEPLYDKIEWAIDANIPYFYFDRKRSSMECNSDREIKEALLVVQQNDKFGLIDRSGTVLCPIRFDKIEPFAEGDAIVTLQGLKGMIDTTGAVKLEPRFPDLKQFTEGLACAATTNDTGELLWGYVDASGNFVIAASFSAAEPFSGGVAAVKNAGNGLWGFISPDGSYVVQPKFDSVDSFCHGRARVGFGTADGDKQFGIIDTLGKYILEPQYAAVGSKYHDGLCFVGKKTQRSRGSNQIMKL